jgi:endonuclease-8
MPEGPEIRRTANQLADALVGAPLVSVFFSFPALKRHETSLRGKRATAIEPHGKALLTHFDHGWTLYSHNQLYGTWKIVVAGQRPDTTRSLRVALETTDRAILLYSASDVAMWKTDDLHAHPFLSRLGPDILDPMLTGAAVEQRLCDPRFHGRRLAALLLDQGFLAGMGNYLRSEVLFEAGIDAARTPATLAFAERRRLAKALLAVPMRSYRSRGIAPASGMRADFLSDTPEGFRFRVFDREGLPCETCGTRIIRRESSGRRLYACPRCQR